MSKFSRHGKLMICDEYIEKIVEDGIPTKLINMKNSEIQYENNVPVLIRNVKHANGKYSRRHLYQQQTADNLGIEYVDWREIHKYDNQLSPENTLWILSDDKLVLEAYEVRRIYKKRNTYTISTYFGTFALMKHNDDTMFVLPENKISLDFSKKSESKFRFKKENKELLVHMFTRGIGYSEATDILGLKPSTKRKIRHFFYSRECRNMVTEELKLILEKHGITEDSVIKDLKELKEQTKGKKGSERFELELIREMFKLLGTYERTTKKTTKGIEASEQDKIEHIQRRLKLTKTEEE